MSEKNTLIREVLVKKNGAGTTIVSFLAARFTYQSREQWQEHINAGRITMNGAPVDERTMPAEGDRIAFTPPHYDEPPVNKNWSIILEDDDFLFVNKPPALPCHPAGIYLHNTLLSLMLDARQDLVARPDLSARVDPSAAGTPDENSARGLHLVNRLDRETSGIVIVAKNTDAAAFAAKALQTAQADKEYDVLVEGDFPAGPEGGIDARGWLERDADSPIRKKLRYIADPGACAECSSRERQFVRTTFFRVPSPAEQTLSLDEPLSLLRARLHTGKTHQIRATIRSLGFPVVGDKLYGRDPEIFLRFASGTMTAADESMLRMPHQALHCARIVMPSMNGDAYEIDAPRPESWITRF
jgi:23S rRNA-/tRNA-specific pseudouridylate synthase